MRALHSMTVFCSSFISHFPRMTLSYFLNDSQMVPVAPIMTASSLYFHDLFLQIWVYVHTSFTFITYFDKFGCMFIPALSNFTPISLCMVKCILTHTLSCLFTYCCLFIIIIIIINIITTTFMQGNYTLKQTMSLGNTVLQLFCC